MDVTPELFAPTGEASKICFSILVSCSVFLWFGLFGLDHMRDMGEG